LDISLSVTLTLSGQVQTQPFDVFVIAKDALVADCKFNLSKYHLNAFTHFIAAVKNSTHGWYRATFLAGSMNATANEIPILNSVKQYSLELYIPGASYKMGIQSGILRKAIANIKNGL